MPGVRGSPHTITTIWMYRSTVGSLFSHVSTRYQPETTSGNSCDRSSCTTPNTFAAWPAFFGVSTWRCADLSPERTGELAVSNGPQLGLPAMAVQPAGPCSNPGLTRRFVGTWVGAPTASARAEGRFGSSPAGAVAHCL